MTKHIHSGRDGFQHEAAEARVPLRFSDDGKRLLTVNRDRTISYWDVHSGQRLGQIDLAFEANEVGPMAVSSDLKKLAVGLTSGAVEVWNLETRQHTATHPINAGEVQFLSFSSKDTFLLARSGKSVNGIWKNVVTVLNVSAARSQTQLQDAFPGFAFSPDETLVAVSMSDYTITVRNLGTQKDMASLKAHTWRTPTLAFSPDGKWLMSAGWDNTSRLWDTKSWKDLDVLRGHMGGVTAATFSSDGKFLASASSDNAFKLWDVSELPARELVSIRLRTAPRDPHSVMFSPDKSFLAVQATSDLTGLEGVLLLRAPSFDEIETREKAKSETKATVGSVK
jgi:WD40 repeat protein